MRKPKAAKGWKTIEDESAAGTTDFGSHGFSPVPSSRANSGADLTTVAFTSLDANFSSARNTAPTDLTLLPNRSFNGNVAEAIAGTLSATDPDPRDTHTFSVSDPRFEIVSNQLKLKDGGRLDFDREPQVNVDVTETDSGGLSFTRTFAVSVADVTEVRFAAFGDYGSSSGTQSVADLVKSLNVDFITTTGDNLYGSDPIDIQVGQFYSEYIGNYTGAYGPGSPVNLFFPALGDNDYSSPAGGTNASAYLNYFTLPGNERYYDYTMGPVHFFVVNSNSQEPDGKSSTSVQAQWLQSALANSTSPFNLVYFHHPAFSTNGSSSTMQWPFEQWGATAVLNGHRHNYERVLQDANGDGVMLPYFVTGLGGASISEFDTPPIAGSAARYDADHGTMLIRASDQSITFEFWSVAGGGTLIDSYTIDEPTGGPAEPLFTVNADIVDFNQVVAGSYLAGSQYDALAGNDTVTLPIDAAAASVAGYDPTKTFVGGDGNDAITGGNLNNALSGGNGNDFLGGGGGGDTLTGGSNADTLDGGAGNDSLSGGGSGDVLKSGLGNDTLDGGSSNDTADYTTAASGVTVNLTSGAATGEGTDTLLNIENVTGSGLDDAITGNSLANVLLGAGGNDILVGASGNDALTGGAGIDQLSGDAGHDTLKWDNADSFDGGLGFDTLDANLSSADTIDLRGAGFANLERILTGSGTDTVTLSLNDVLADTVDNQFVADLGSSSPDTLNIDLDGGWSATTSNPTLGPTGVAAGISVSGMAAYTFTNGTDTVTVFSNAEVVQAQILSS
jgi:Ca2+-binding RTX toxin-like protein